MKFDSRVIKYTKFDSSNKMIFDLSDLENFRFGSPKRALKIFENFQKSQKRAQQPPPRLLLL